MITEIEYNQTWFVTRLSTIQLIFKILKRFLKLVRNEKLEFISIKIRATSTLKS